MNNVDKLNKVLPNNYRYVSQAIADKAFESEYNRQAIDFLVDTETTCDIAFLGLNKPSWGKQKVNHYEVTLKNKRSTFTFNFWDSINNTERGKKLGYDFYSVLACLSFDYNISFDDFISENCFEIKSESDYIKLKSTYLEIERQNSELKKLFTESELERLSDIN